MLFRDLFRCFLLLVFVFVLMLAFADHATAQCKNGSCSAMPAASAVSAPCSSSGTATAAAVGKCGFFAGMHQRKADRHAAKAAYHEARAMRTVYLITTTSTSLAPTTAAPACNCPPAPGFAIPKK